MKIKTVTTVDGINSVDFGDNAPRFYWFKNLGDSTLYVSPYEKVEAGGKDVTELPKKSAASVETTAGKVYILGAGKVEIHNTSSKFCPFMLPPAKADSNGIGLITLNAVTTDYTIGTITEMEE